MKQPEPQQNPVVTLTKLKQNARKALDEQQRKRPEFRVTCKDAEVDLNKVQMTPILLAKMNQKRHAPQWVKKPKMFQKSPEENSEKIRRFIDLLNKTDVQIDVSFKIQTYFRKKV